MGYLAIRDGLIDYIDTNLVAVTNTSYKVHERVPETVIDAHGYSIIIQPSNSGFGAPTSIQYNDAQTWFIDVYSPNVGTSYRSEHEDRLLKYADKLTQLFANTRTLDVAGVQGVRLTALQFNNGDFPINSRAMKYHFRLTITVGYSLLRSC